MTRKYSSRYSPHARPLKRFHVVLPFPNGDPPPNDEYWKDAADEKLGELMDIAGDVKARELTEDITGTWREINDAIKDILRSFLIDYTRPCPPILRTMDDDPRTAAQIEDGVSSDEWFDDIRPIEF